jgi:signal transduction histidine kinase
VASGVGEDPQAAVDTIRGALVLPWVALESADGILVSSGEPTPLVRRLPLTGAGGVDLVVGLRPGDLTLPADDAHVLRLTAPLLTLALRAHALNASLRESRAEARGLLEEERRRLRRDLHDGLGPQLSGIAFAADAAANLIPSDPSAARDIVVRLRADAAAAIEDVRRLVYGMRPPALDELGLVGAIEQRSHGLGARAGSPLVVTVSADTPLPPLPAAVEVAAFRIAVEALANVSRHSAAATATVRLTADASALRVVVEDFGPGDGGPWAPGVGLQSMRERAHETGGSLECGPTASGGLVEAVLPLDP